VEDRSARNGSGPHPTAVNCTRYGQADANAPANIGPVQGQVFGQAGGGSMWSRKAAPGQCFRGVQLDPAV